jgi:hypothetical protein
MSIRLLEHIRDELRGSGAVQNTPEFCTSWLGRSEGYIRTLRFPSTRTQCGSAKCVFPQTWTLCR